MDPILPEVILKQVERLPTDLRSLAQPFSEQARRLLGQIKALPLDKVYLVGVGDSFHAACASQFAFQSIAGIACEPIGAQAFLHYSDRCGHSAGPPLVVATSASGQTPRVIQAVERAREQGAFTFALTGKPGSAVTTVADQTMDVSVTDLERGPGIRTYQASVLGLLVLAIELGRMRNVLRVSEARQLVHELAALSVTLEATNSLIDDRCAALATVLAQSTSMMVVGSGPSYGTARFAAAKIVEASGILAVGQDLEEWWHVERFAYPLDMPIFVVAPVGRSFRRAADFVAMAGAIGKRVIVVTPEAEADSMGRPFEILPVCGVAREEFSPLLYHLFASHFAFHLSRHLGRCLFQSDRSGPHGSRA